MDLPDIFIGYKIFDHFVWVLDFRHPHLAVEKAGLLQGSARRRGMSKWADMAAGMCLLKGGIGLEIMMHGQHGRGCAFPIDRDRKPRQDLLEQRGNGMWMCWLITSD